MLVRPDYFDEHEKVLSTQTQQIKKRKLPADLKLALYRQRNYRRRLLRERGKEIKVKHADARQTASKATQSTSNTNPIVDSLPKSLQTKGENFLTFLQSIPSFRINNKGEIVYGHQHVAGSRIVDIVHDFVRERPKKTPAKGWKIVAAALKDHNVPKEFVGNRSRWQYMQNIESEISPRSTPERESVGASVSDLGSLRRRQLQFQSGTGLGRVLKAVKWRKH